MSTFNKIYDWSKNGAARVGMPQALPGPAAGAVELSDDQLAMVNGGVADGGYGNDLPGIPSDGFAFVSQLEHARVAAINSPPKK